jgi:hypothetical protein
VEKEGAWDRFYFHFAAKRAQSYAVLNLLRFFLVVPWLKMQLAQ